MSAPRPSRTRALLLTTALACCASSCTPSDDTAPGDTAPEWTGLVKGYGISPLGFPLDYAQLGEFYTEVGGQEGGGVMWNGAWRDDAAGGSDAGTIPQAGGGLPVQAESYGFVPILVFGWRSGETLYLNVPEDATNDWTNEAARDLFLSMLTEHVRTHEPPYVFIGNENSLYHQQDPDDYANWITFYEHAYDAIKAESESTMVGTVFNYEHLAGQGALTGFVDPYWEALEAHDLSKVDLLGVTVYPFLQYATVDEVPSDYLEPLFDRIGSTPVAITETGWPAEDLGDLEIPWEQGEDTQVDFVSTLGDLLAGRDVLLVNWLFLNPMVDPGDASDEWQLFGSVSVRDTAGAERPVYQPWLELEL